MQISPADPGRSASTRRGGLGPDAIRAAGGGGYGPPPGGYGPPGGGGYGPPPGGGGYGPPPGGGGGWGPPGGAPPQGPPGGFGPPQGGFGAPPGMGPGMGAPPPKKNPALLFGLIGGGALLLVLLVGGVLMLRRGSGGTETVSDGKGGTVTLPAKSISKAHAHVPPGCDILMRVDVGQLLALPSVQKHLVPELDAIQQGATDPDSKKVEELLRKAGIDPKKDIKDGVMCAVGIDQGDANEKFVFVLGGELRPEALVPALKEVDGSKVTEITIDGRKAAQGTDKDGSTYIMGQAADAAIVFASDRALYEAAVKDSTTYQSEYNLAVNTEASFVVGKALIDKGATDGGRNNPFTRDLAAVTRVAGILTLANPRGEVRITAKSPADAKKINTTITTLLPAIKRSAGREKSQAGEIEALAAAKTRIDGNDVVVDLPWTTAGVEQAAQKLAELLRQERQKGKISL